MRGQGRFRFRSPQSLAGAHSTLPSTPSLVKGKNPLKVQTTIAHPLEQSRSRIRRDYALYGMLNLLALSTVPPSKGACVVGSTLALSATFERAAQDSGSPMLTSSDRLTPSGILAGCF